MARVRKVTGHHTWPLAGWTLAAAPPGHVEHPKDLDAANLAWVPATVPGTVGGALAAAGRWDSTSAGRFDELDWWFRCEFPRPAVDSERPVVLKLGGLATLAHVWLNDTHVLASENMFLTHEVDVRGVLGETNVLAIRFRALDEVLRARWPRPRWRTRLVDSQQLRWIRTTLLGRIPGWSPPVNAVGPWRPVELEARPVLALHHADLRTRTEGTVGVADVRLILPMPGERPPEAAILTVGEAQASLDCAVHGNSVIVGGAVRIPDVERWWPHTHGAPRLYPARVSLRLDGRDIDVDLGRVGFRTVEVARRGDDFGIRVNGLPVFCRGACWTPLDLVTLGGTAASYRATLETVRDAGMNMLRVGGTMVYECDEFFDLCDELGILVWQDFMFASLDYPASDPTFVASVRAEAEQTLERIQTHPSVAVLCGNSEVEQQAAMLGLPRETWQNPIFRELLPDVCRRLRPDVPYWPSSPSGGALPFQVSAGVAHYYGVGAYLRPLDDARRSDVRFASECLAFANVPEGDSLERMFEPRQSVPHHPLWKAGIPRDSGAGWDFEDVRDHYLERLFGLDALKLRYSDPERYLLLGRLTSGEVMTAVFGEWRRRRSTCTGGLVWFLRDLRPGAGWGVLDVYGRPKAAYYYLRRVLQPIVAFFSDEGLNGLTLHAVNETDRSREMQLSLALYQHGESRVTAAEELVILPARDQIELDVGTLVGRFLDPTYVYRFGPPGHDLVVATMRDRAGRISPREAFYFPLGLPANQEREVGLEATAREGPDRTYRVTIRTRRFAQSVAVEASGFLPDDNYFHLAPGGERMVTLRAVESPRPLQGVVRAANAATPVAIQVEDVR